MILITGGTGFVGQTIIRALLDENVPTRCLARKGTYHEQFDVSSLELAWGDITDEVSLEQATQGIDTVIHCVGILQEKGKNITHQKIVVEGTRHLLRACQKSQVKKIIYISGLGTSEKAASKYHKAKWAAECMIRESGLQYVIFRPSVIFGEGDDFLNKFIKMIQFSPFLPVIGDGKYKLQPVSVHDLVNCIHQCVEDETIQNKVFEIGGPQRLEFNEIMDIMLKGAGKRRLKVHIPLVVMKQQVKILEKLPNPPLTGDQLIMLQTDNVCDNSTIHSTFHLNLTPLSEGLKEYPWYKSKTS